MYDMMYVYTYVICILYTNYGLYILDQPYPQMLSLQGDGGTGGLGTDADSAYVAQAQRGRIPMAWGCAQKL